MATPPSRIPRPTPPEIAYVAGWGRSGSTLVERVLDAIPGVVGVGELSDLWQKQARRARVACGCGRTAVDCAFWPAVLEAAWGRDAEDAVRSLRDLRGELCRLRRTPGLLLSRRRATRSRLTEYGDLLVAAYTGVATVAGADVVVDSSKSPIDLAALVATGTLDVSTVHLVRDPVAVSHSWARDARRRTGGRDQPLRTYGPARSAIEWTWRNALAEVAGRRSDRYLRVSYERLAASPLEGFEEIARMLGLDPAELPVSGDGTAHLGPGHGIRGNPMRGAHGAVPITPDSEWRAAVPRSRRAVVRALTAPVAWRYR